jgi:hypothetical protein
MIGDMRVTVLGAAEDGDRLDVDVLLGGVDDADGAEGFRLIASGRPVPAGAGSCGATTVTSNPCTLVFDVSTADGESRVLRYRRGDDQARWDLRPPSDDGGADDTVNRDD